MDEFSVETRSTPLADVIRLAGDADLYVAPQVREAFETALGNEPSAVVVDMSALTFVDSTTLGLLLALQGRLEATGAALLLVCDNRAVLRALEVTALDSRFRVTPSLTDALRDVIDRVPAAA